MTLILLFFMDINNELYFNGNELKDYCRYFPKEINKITFFIDELAVKYTYKIIKEYYFDKYFSFKKEYGIDKILNVTQFLEYAIFNFDEFREDITDELEKI